MGTKQTKIKDKANCGGTQDAVIHIQPQLNYHVQNLARHPPQDIEMGHPCTGDVNAMVYVMLCFVVIITYIWIYYKYLLIYLLQDCIIGTGQLWDLYQSMMTSTNGNIFRITGPLWGEFTGHQWIPLAKAGDTELWCFLWSVSPVNSPHKGQWHRALMFSLICAWLNGWVNNREAGDLRCHLIIMTSCNAQWNNP